MEKVAIKRQKNPSIQTTITDYNQDYLDAKLAEIQSAQSVKELNALSIDRNYQDSTTDIIEKQINERRFELEQITEQKVIQEVIGGLADIRTDIRSATKSDQLLDLPSIGDIRRAYGKDEASKISQLIADKGLELFEKEEEQRRIDNLPEA